MSPLGSTRRQRDWNEIRRHAISASGRRRCRVAGLACRASAIRRDRPAHCGLWGSSVDICRAGLGRGPTIIRTDQVSTFGTGESCAGDGCRPLSSSSPHRIKGLHLRVQFPFIRDTVLSWQVLNPMMWTLPSIGASTRRGPVKKTSRNAILGVDHEIILSGELLWYG